MEISESKDSEPCQASIENSPTSGLFKFLVARGAIEPGTGMLDPAKLRHNA